MDDSVRVLGSRGPRGPRGSLIYIDMGVYSYATFTFVAAVAPHHTTPQRTSPSRPRSRGLDRKNQTRQRHRQLQPHTALTHTRTRKHSYTHTSTITDIQTYYDHQPTTTLHISSYIVPTSTWFNSVYSWPPYGWYDTTSIVRYFSPIKSKTSSRPSTQFIRRKTIDHRSHKTKQDRRWFSQRRSFYPCSPSGSSCSTAPSGSVTDCASPRRSPSRITSDTCCRNHPDRDLCPCSAASICSDSTRSRSRRSPHSRNSTETSTPSPSAQHPVSSSTPTASSRKC